MQTASWDDLILQRAMVCTHERSNSRVWPSWSCSSLFFPEGSLVGGLPFVTEGLASVTGGLPSVTGGLPSVTGGRPPVTEGLPPVTGGDPSVTGGFPSGMESLPSVTRGLPSVTGGRPCVTGGLPSGRTSNVLNKKYTQICLHFSICACHPCAGAMLIFFLSFQF